MLGGFIRPFFLLHTIVVEYKKEAVNTLSTASLSCFVGMSMTTPQPHRPL